MSEDGVTFQSHIDGSRHEMSPERSIEIQGLLGSDIQMQLDECVALPADRDRVDPQAMETVAALGGALQDRLRRPAGTRDVRHRAGRRRRANCGRIGAGYCAAST
jgi:tRNA-guanine family transglycosylase